MYADEWAEWHAEHERRRAAPHGFLAVTGLHWLTGEPQRFDDVPGSWSDGPAGVTVTLAEGEELTVEGVPVHGRYTFAVIDEDGVDAGFGDAVAEVARRGPSVLLRPRHPGNPARLAYDGTPAYQPDEKWIVPGRFVPFDEPREIAFGTVVDGLDGHEVAPGRVEFAIGGVPLSLTVFEGASPGSLTTLFTDATSGVTTYPANRRLPIPAPSPDGSVLLDFNRATNPPCAYTEFATCALPPDGNRLPVAIEAGERYVRSPVM
jgi:hypothetical protein